MHVLSALILAFSANTDAFVIGISYGAKKIHINPVSNIVVSLIAGLGTFCSMLFGKILSAFISSKLENLIGSSVLALFGVYILIGAIRKKQNNPSDMLIDRTVPRKNYFSKAFNNPEIIDANHSNNIEFKEALILGGLLCINNIGLGVGASITGLNLYITAFFSFLFSTVFLQAGCYTGRKVISHKFSKYADIISACIIIIVGLYELFI